MSFKPGDVVVCIGTACPYCEAVNGSRHPQPTLRKLYRVGLVGKARCRTCRTVMPCFVPIGYDDSVKWAWPQACFRKVEPADTDIFELACTSRDLELI